MRRTHLLCLAAVLVAGGLVFAAEPDLAEYRTVEKAITARISKAGTPVASRPGFLGVHAAADLQGRLAVADVAADSPAAKAGVQRGDLLLKVDGKVVKGEDAFLDLLRTKAPGDAVKLALTREGKTVDAQATLEPLSRPLVQGKQRAVLGVQVATALQENAVLQENVSLQNAMKPPGWQVAIP